MRIGFLASAGYSTPKPPMPRPATPTATRSFSQVLKPNAGIGVNALTLVVEPAKGPKLLATDRSGRISSKPISMWVPLKLARPAGFTKKAPSRLVLEATPVPPSAELMAPTPCRKWPFVARAELGESTSRPTTMAHEDIREAFIEQRPPLNVREEM
jgi:hypothetical protein